MKLSPLNYLNIVFWCSALVLPFLAQEAGLIDLITWRTFEGNGYLSILTGSFLHGSYNHLMSNLPGMLLGTTVLLNFQRKMYLPVIILGLLVPPLVYFFMGAAVVGISGLLYTVRWYIIFRGLMSRDPYRFVIGVIFMIFYGSTLEAALPTAPLGVAWASHLAGFLLAFNLALFQKLIPFRTYRILWLTFS